MSGGYFLTIQDPMLAPPEMPTTYANNSEWSKLCKVDEKLLASYEKKCNQVNTGNMTMTKQRYLKEDLVALCGTRIISITVKEQKVGEGWLGKPKGMLQILWEPGWIDSSKVVTASKKHALHSKDGKKKILVRTEN
jgi:hypothetical protein